MGSDGQVMQVVFIALRPTALKLYVVFFLYWREGSEIAYDSYNIHNVAVPVALTRIVVNVIAI